MKIQACVRYAISIIVAICCGWFQEIQTTKCVKDKSILHRGFSYPDYSNTYAAVQLFSISDIGRTTYCIKKPISMVLSRPAEYEPDCELTGSPMLKVKASGVSLDFNGFEIEKSSQNRIGEYMPYAVGIEVGFSPAELAADPMLEQVQNVVIKNGGLSNFEMGIVIHAGVKNVIIEDFYVSRSPLGILLLGQQDNQVSSIMFKNVRVTGDFQDHALTLQWAKVKVEQTDVSSIDSQNAGTSILNGKPGLPAAGYGYGAEYCFMQLEHNPVTNADAYCYQGIFIKHAVNIMLESVMVKCMGYQQDRHEIVPPGQTVGSVTNPAASAVAINGDIVPGEVTSTVTKGISIIDSSTIFLKNCEAVNGVSALTTYGLYTKATSSISVQHSAFSSNDAHHLTTGLAPQVTTDAEVRVTTEIVDVKTDATIASLYTTFCVDILALPITTSPLLDSTIEPFRDVILDHKAAIDAGVSLSEMMFHVEQVIVNANVIIAAYNALVLAGTTPTLDDADAHLQASALLKSGTDLFNHLFRSIYVSGRSCYGLYFDNVSVVEMQDIITNHNKAQHFVAGLYLQNSDVIEMTSVASNHNVSDDLGNPAAMPVPQAASSHTHGVVLLHTDTVSIDSLTANYNTSFGLTRGLYAYDMDSCKANGISCTNNEAVHPTLSEGWAAGICLYSATSCTFAHLNANANEAKQVCHGMHLSCVSSTDFECAHTDNNISQQAEVVGSLFDRVHSLNLKHMSATSNVGSLKSYGMLFDNCSAVNIDGAAADDNNVDRDNPAATDCYGMWWKDPEACFLNHVSGSNNRGRTLGVGLYASNTKTFHVDKSDFCLNSATECVDGEKNRCNDAANASKFFSRDYPSGALGMYFLESCDVSLQEVNACKNFAHRSAGIFALHSHDFVLQDCVTSFQAATGQYFINDPFKLEDDGPDNDILFCDFPIPLTQYSTLFGSPELEDPLNPPNIVPSDQINLLQAICCFLKSVALIPCTPGDENTIKNRIICSLQDCSNPCERCPSFYCVDKKFAASWLLIQAAMTKYRFFGGAVGLHMHDCEGFAVKKHFANGNTSLKDNAAGIACTGTSRNHLFEGDRAINNDGWTESKLGAITPGRYDLAAVKPFYDALYATTLDDITDDFDLGLGNQLMPRLDRFCTDIINKKLITYFKINIDCSCPGGSGEPEDLWFTSPVGGMGVGVLLGDCAEHIEMRAIDCANNKGYSGFAFGLLQDVSANNNIDLNRFYQNSVNLLGLCFGLADITLHSTSIMMRNFMFCNRIGDYLNFNYFVPYDPTDPFGLYFPVKTGFNGDFSTLVTAGAYDNIEIKFTRPAPQNLCVPDYIGSRDPTMPDMLSCWEDAGFLDTTGMTISSEYQQCIDNISALAPVTGSLIQKFVGDITTAVLSNPAGPAAVNAGRDASVTSGLLEAIAFPASTVADVNRMMSVSKLQELVCQEIATHLQNDPVLLIIQEVLSTLIPKKRSHIPGLNHFAARVAGVDAGLRANVLPECAQTVATIASAVLEHCTQGGGDPGLYSGRDMFAMSKALQHTTRNLSNDDLIAAQQALGNQGIPAHPDTQVQDAIVRHVAVRLERGLSESQAVAKVVDGTRAYGDIVADFIAVHGGASAQALDVGIKVVDSFCDYKYEWSLSGSPPKNIREEAVIKAAGQAVELFDSVSADERLAFLCGILSSFFVQSTLCRNPLSTLADLEPVIASATTAGKNIMFNCLMDLESNILLTDEQKELAALVGGLATANLMSLKSIDQEQALSDGKIAAQDFAQLIGVFADPCTSLSHTIQMQIDKGARLARLADLGNFTPAEASACLFDYFKLHPNYPANRAGARRAWHCKIPQTYSTSYNSDLHYRDVAFGSNGLKLFVAGAVDGGTGSDSGLLIFNKDCLLLKKIAFSGVDVQSVTTHPQKDWVAVGLSDGTVKLVDTTDAKAEAWVVHPTAVLPAHGDEVEVVRFSVDGSKLVSSGKDNIVKVFDTSSSDPAHWVELCSGTPAFDLSAIGSGHVRSVACKGNDLIAVAHSGSTAIHLLKVSDCSKITIPITSGHKAQSVAFNADGSQLVVTTDNSGAGAHAVVEVFDTTDADPINWTSSKEFVVTGASLLQSAVYHSDHNYLALADATSTAKLRLFDLTDADPINWAEFGMSPIATSTTTLGFAGLAWSSQGINLVGTTNASEMIQYNTSKADVSLWAETKRAQYHTDKVRFIACNQAGTLIATASDDHSVKIWDGQNSRQLLIASIDTANFPAHAHSDVVTSVVFSADGNYLFTGSRDDDLKVWDMSSGSPVFVQDITLSTDINALATVMSGGDDYLTVGLSDGTIKIVKFDRGPDTLSVITSIDNANNPGNEHTGAINSLALNAAGTRLVSASDDGDVKCWNLGSTIPGGAVATLECILNDTALGGAAHWHVGAITSVGLSADSSTVVSGGVDDKVFISDITTPGSPVHKAKITDASGDVTMVQFNPFSAHLLTGSTDGFIRLYDVSNIAAPSLIKGFAMPSKTICSASWCNNGYDLISSGLYGFGRHQFINRFCVAIAQQVHDELPYQDRARNKAKALMEYVDISDAQATVVAQAALDHLLVHPADVAGAARIVCDTFMTTLTGSELCDATVKIIQPCDHPVDEAVSLTDLQGVDTATARATANQMYEFLRAHQGEVDAAAAMCSINNKFCRSIAQTLHDYSVPQAKYLIELVFPVGSYPGLSTAVAGAGSMYLGAHPGDVLGAAQVVCDAFATAGESVYQIFCTAVVKQMQQYIGFARQVAELGCMLPVGLSPSGGSGLYREIHRLTTELLDALRADPTAPANQAAAQAICFGTSLVPCAPTPTETTIDTALQNQMNVLDVSLATPISLTKQLRRTFETCSITDVTIPHPTDPIETSAIASTLVGRMHGQKVVAQPLDLLDIDITADMADKLLHGGLLPCGSLKNLRGDALAPPAGPAGQWGSATTSLAGQFTSLKIYLDALGADAMATVLGLTAYSGLNVAEKAAIARAIVLRTLLCGDEQNTRDLFNGTTNAAYPAQIATLVHELVTTDVAPPLGLAGLSLAGRQEIAVVALLFYDQFNPYASSAELQAIVAGAFAGASAAKLIDTSKEPFFALFGGLGTAAGFMQDRSLNPMPINQQAVSDFVQIGSELVQGLIGDHMSVPDIGSVGYDGYAKDLAEPVLAALAAGMMCEGLSVILDEAIAHYGQFALPLGYNQIFADQLCKAIAKVVRDNGNTVSLGAAIAQFAGLSPIQATAVVTAAVAPADIQSARIAVCKEFKTQAGSAPTPSTFCTALVKSIVDIVQHPASFALNPLGLTVFGATGKGHAADVGSELMKSGGIASALANQLSGEVYEYLVEHPFDVAGGIDLCMDSLR